MIMIVDLASQPRFFVGVAIGLDISGVVGLVINGIVLTETDIAVNFSRLFL